MDHVKRIAADRDREIQATIAQRDEALLEESESAPA
jgi:hypothetical protein